MGFERDEFIERTEKQKMWLYTGGAFDRGCDRGDPCSNLNSNFQRAASQVLESDRNSHPKTSRINQSESDRNSQS